MTILAHLHQLGAEVAGHAVAWELLVSQHGIDAVEEILIEHSDPLTPLTPAAVRRLLDGPVTTSQQASQEPPMPTKSSRPHRKPGETRQAILDYLRDHGPSRPAAIQEAVGITSSGLCYHAGQMGNEGLLRRTGTTADRLYALPLPEAGETQTEDEDSLGGSSSSSTMEDDRQPITGPTPQDFHLDNTSTIKIGSGAMLKMSSRALKAKSGDPLFITYNDNPNVMRLNPRDKTIARQPFAARPSRLLRLAQHARAQDWPAEATWLTDQAIAILEAPAGCHLCGASIEDTATGPRCSECGHDAG